MKTSSAEAWNKWHSTIQSPKPTGWLPYYFILHTCWNMMTINCFYGAGFVSSSVGCVLSVRLQRCPVWWVSGRSGQAVLSPAGRRSAGGAGPSCRSRSMEAKPVPIWRSMPAVQSTGPITGTVTTHLVSKKKKTTWILPQYSLTFFSKNRCNYFMLLPSPPHSSPAWSCWCIGRSDIL